MDLMLSLFRYVHIAAGGVGLAAFWIPVLTRKGGRNHRRFGTVFKWCAYLVLGAAAASISVRLVGAAFQGIGPRDQPESFAFIVFLGYLTVVTWIMVRHGVRVLEHKADLTRMNTRLDRGLAVTSIAATVFLLAYALWYSPPNRVVLFALSPIGALIGKGILEAITGRQAPRNAWLLEHLGAMLGAGIAFHTAFAVFGLSRLYDFGMSGLLSIVPWILPTLVGVPASIIWSRKYQRRAPPARA